MSNKKHKAKGQLKRVRYDSTQRISKSNPMTSIFNGQWLPPKGAGNYFSMLSDDAFKRRHPFGYGFVVFLGIIVLLLPAIIYAIVISSFLGEYTGWGFLGSVGGFIFGIGLFNFVAIIVKQYMGHLVSIACFAFGIILMALPLF